MSLNTLEQQLRIRLQPKQGELWHLWDESDVTRIGFGGARGGAKSGGGRRCMLLRRLKYANTTGLIIRRTLKELEQSHLIKLFEEFPGLQSFYREQKKQLKFPNGSSLFFGSAQSEKEMTDFYSAEFGDIMPDEAQEFTQIELEKLSGSNRSTSHPDMMPKTVYPFMPSISETGLPPVGLGYLKRVFVEKQFKDQEHLHKWAFIQAFSWDNIEWCRPALTVDGISEEQFYSEWTDAERREYFLTRTDYGRNLAALTNSALREAWLYGKWDVYQGQYFQNFDPAKHVLSYAEVKDRIKPWHKRWASLDWGFDHPFCVHWHAQDERGHVITYREFWGRGMNEHDLGKEIGKLTGSERLTAFPCSWDAGKLSPRALKTVPKSIIQMISDALPVNFPRPFPADSSPGTRPSGARLMSQLLDSGMWQISEECPRLIECMPTLVRDPKNTEDVLKVDFSSNQVGDDSYDCARMGLQYMLGSARKPESEVIREQAQTIEDPVARALFIHKQTFARKEANRAVKPASTPSWMTRV